MNLNDLGWQGKGMLAGGDCWLWVTIQRYMGALQPSGDG